MGSVKPALRPCGETAAVVFGEHVEGQLDLGMVREPRDFFNRGGAVPVEDLAVQDEFVPLVRYRRAARVWLRTQRHRRRWLLARRPV